MRRFVDAAVCLGHGELADVVQHRAQAEGDQVARVLGLQPGPFGHDVRAQRVPDGDRQVRDRRAVDEQRRVGRLQAVGQARVRRSGQRLGHQRHDRLAERVQLHGGDRGFGRGREGLFELLVHTLLGEREPSGDGRVELFGAVELHPDAADPQPLELMDHLGGELGARGQQLHLGPGRVDQ
jgi:hypothetical protein